VAVREGWRGFAKARFGGRVVSQRGNEIAGDGFAFWKKVAAGGELLAWSFAPEVVSAMSQTV